MKNFFKKGSITLVIVLLVIGTIKIVGDKILQRQQMAKNISEFMNEMKYPLHFTYAPPKVFQKVESITLPYEGDLKLKLCSDNLLGNIQIRIENEKGEEVFALEEKNIKLNKNVHLDQGKYKVHIQTGVCKMYHLKIQFL